MPKDLHLAAESMEYSQIVDLKWHPREKGETSKLDEAFA
jgi:hypothetical protein